MKICINVVALCAVFHRGLWEVTAFSISPNSLQVNGRSSTALSSSPFERAQGNDVVKKLTPSSSSPIKKLTVKSRQPRPTGEPEDLNMFPLDLPLTQIEGGDTLRTWKLPPHCDRVQILLKTTGRPLKAKVELWCGPLRRTHFMDIDNQDGNKTPYRSVIKFKNVDSAGPQTLKLSSKASAEFAVLAGLDIPSADRCAGLAAVTENVFDTSERTYSQGEGSIRTFPIPSNVESVQLIFWSKNVGKKSLKAKIEVLQGPNNQKQLYDLQCGGGSQPFHAVFKTPGTGVNIRITNKKFLEDGSFEVAVVPYEVSDVSLDASADGGWWS